MQYLAEPHHIERQILQVILMSQDPQIILTDIASKLGQLFGVDVCALVSSGNNAETLQIGWWRKHNYPELECKRLDRVLGEFLRGDRYRVGPFELESFDMQNESLHPSGELLCQLLSLRAVLAISLRFQGSVIGTILLGKDRPYDWTNSEKELLNIVSEAVTIAISQMQLKQQAQTKARYQNLLKEVSGAIAQNSDVERILNCALTSTVEALQVDRGAILLLKYKQPPLKNQTRDRIVKATAAIACYCSADNRPEQSNREHSFELADSPLTQEAWKIAPQSLAIAEGVNFSDPAKDTLATVFGAKNSQALLMMPLMGNPSNDTKSPLVLGFLVLQQDTSRSWNNDELEIVNWIGIQLSTAIIHSQTLSRVQSLVEDRTTQLKWSLEVQAKLSEKMRQQIEQLKQLNELKDDFLNSMSHELKTPLTSMKMAIKMLRQPGLPEESKEKYLNILEQEWNREYNLIKDLLTLQKVESENFKIDPQELNIETIVAQLSKPFEQKWLDSKGLNLKIAANHSPLVPLTLCTDADSLRHILDELLLNAGKYAAPDTTVDLQVTRQTLKGNHQIEITVSNRGAGISAEELPNIFDKFRRGKGVTDRAVPGTGLGLTLVKHLIEHLNGTINVSSLPLEENSSTFVTAFTITLPQFCSVK
ncbi:MAG: ATP-binding protein [Xenococcaceae cyanobacterium]